MTLIISLEGNIGCGKSSLLKNMQDYISKLNIKNKIIFLQEPVDIWTNIKDEKNESIIKAFYKDADKYAFPFQMLAYISRLSKLKEALKENPDIIFTERSVYTDKNIFAKMLYDDNKIGSIEYQIYTQWFDHFLAEIPPISSVYLKTSPDIAYARIKERNRDGENQISLSYIENCHLYHEEWFKETKNKYITINANDNIYQNPKMSDIWTENILSILCFNK